MVSRRSWKLLLSSSSPPLQLLGRACKEGGDGAGKRCA